MNKENVKELLEESKLAHDKVQVVYRQALESVNPRLQMYMPVLGKSRMGQIFSGLEYIISGMGDDDVAKDWVIAEIERMGYQLGTLSPVLTHPDAPEFKRVNKNYHDLCRVSYLVGASLGDIDGAYMSGLADAYEEKMKRGGLTWN